MVRRATKKKRGIKTRKPKKLILIGCEGDNQTEKLYFSHFNQLQKDYRIIFAKGIHTDPIGVVEDTIKSLEAEDLIIAEGDFAICCIDVDFTEDRKHQLDEALKKAKQKGVKVFFSNPCFEIWFLLHYRYSTRQYSSNVEVLNEIKEYISEYHKSYDVFGEIYPLTNEGIKNSKKLEEFHDKQNTNNKYTRIPSSNVYKIIEEILKHISEGGGETYGTK